MFDEGRKKFSEREMLSATLPHINTAWIVVVLKNGLRGKITRINRRELWNGPEVFWYCQQKS
jgi:hypothetical protein